MEADVQTRRRLGAALGAVAIGSAATASAAAQAPTASGETTFDRVRRTSVLRIAALPGEMPFFRKDLSSGEWSGVAIDMAKSIATTLGARLEYIESTYGNSVLDLQANKIDLAFALNPTPKRALVIDFTHPFYLHGFGMVGKKGFHAENWSDLNKSEVKVAVDIGSAHEIAARRFAPKATIIALKARDDCILAVQTGRADCVILAVNLGLTAVKKNPALGEFQMLHQPRMQLPTRMGIRMEPDKRWRDFLNAWVDYNRGIQQIREWLYAGLAINGVKPEDVPADVEL